jgi:hypothetical protein
VQLPTVFQQEGDYHQQAIVIQDMLHVHLFFYKSTIGFVEPTCISLWVLQIQWLI